MKSSCVLSSLRLSFSAHLTRPVSSVQNLNNTVLLLLHLADTLRQQNMLLNVRLDVDVRNLSMVMEEMKLVDVHHTTLIKNFTIIKGTVVVAIYMK